MATVDSIINYLKKLHELTTDFNILIDESKLTLDPLIVSNDFLKTMCNLILDTNTDLKPFQNELQLVYKQLRELSYQDFNKIWEQMVQVYPFKKQLKESLQELCNHRFVKTSLYRYLTNDKACVDQDSLNIVYMWLVCHTSYLETKRI